MKSDRFTIDFYFLVRTIRNLSRSCFHNDSVLQDLIISLGLGSYMIGLLESV